MVDEQGFGQAGHAFDEHVAVGEEADEHFFHHGVLAHDHLADLGQQFLLYTFQ